MSPSPYGMNPGNLWAPGLKNGDDRFCHIHLPYFFRHPEMGAVFILKFTWSISPTAGVQGRALCPGSTPGAPLL